MKLKSRITEFSDGSRIFHSETNETPKDIASALGLDVNMLTNLNRSNYPNISNNTILQKGMIVEIPSSNYAKPSLNVCAEEASSVAELASGSMSVHVFGSGENVGKRTDGQLLAKDRNRPYVVQCGGREMKLSEFCQLGGNKKNRPRESIIISSTNECLFEYEARVLARRGSGVVSAPIEISRNLTARYEHLKSRYMKVLRPGERQYDMPEKGYIVTVFNCSTHIERIGVVLNRRATGWYEVGILHSDPCMIGVGLRSLSYQDTIQIRGHNLVLVPHTEQIQDIQTWALRYHSALAAISNCLSPFSQDLRCVIEKLADSIEILRLESSKSGFKTFYNGWLQVLCFTTNPVGWEEVCDCLVDIKKSKLNLYSILPELILIRESLHLLSMPLLATEVLPKNNKMIREIPTTVESRTFQNDEKVASETEKIFVTAKMCLEQLEEQELTLENELKTLDAKITVESRRRRALIRRQDASIGEIYSINNLADSLVVREFWTGTLGDTSNLMDARSLQFHTAKVTLENEISLLTHTLLFLESSLCAMQVKQVQGPVT